MRTDILILLPRQHENMSFEDKKKFSDMAKKFGVRVLYDITPRMGR